MNGTGGLPVPFALFRGGAFRRSDESLEQRSVLGKRGRQHFGVPLHAESEAHRGMPQRFDYPIGGGGDHLEIRSGSEHRLMVKRVHFEAIPIQNLPEWVIAIGKHHRVPNVITPLSPLVLPMGHIACERHREMLDQRPALGNIHDLNPPTNAEGGEVALHRVSPGLDLESVALVIDPIGLRVDLGVAEGAGVEVAPST
jgi:hypothetical protein